MDKEKPGKEESYEIYFTRNASLAEVREAVKEFGRTPMGDVLARAFGSLADFDTAKISEEPLELLADVEEKKLPLVGETKLSLFLRQVPRLSVRELWLDVYLGGIKGIPSRTAFHDRRSVNNELLVRLRAGVLNVPSSKRYTYRIYVDPRLRGIRFPSAAEEWRARLIYNIGVDANESYAENQPEFPLLDESQPGPIRKID